MFYKKFILYFFLCYFLDLCLFSEQMLSYGLMFNLKLFGSNVLISGLLSSITSDPN